MHMVCLLFYGNPRPSGHIPRNNLKKGSAKVTKAAPHSPRVRAPHA